MAGGTVALQQKRFRIETMMAGSTAEKSQSRALDDATQAGASDGQIAGWHREMMDAIEELSRKISDTAARPRETSIAPTLLDQYKTELREAAKLAHQLESLEQAIDQTKLEIARLYDDGASDERLTQLVDELEHVVGGTESATETILSAAEGIDGKMQGFISSLPSGYDDTAALEIQEHTTAIMEACNFQDLTGQRITKVVTALRFIEERVTAMREIWGEQAFEGIEIEKSEPKDADPASFLHGPAREGEEGRASQADIDALFD